MDDARERHALIVGYDAGWHDALGAVQQYLHTDPSPRALWAHVNALVRDGAPFDMAPYPVEGP